MDPIPMAGFQRLLSLVERLRGPGGCPWDQRQTWTSMRRYLLEEAFELAEAIDTSDTPDGVARVREELGDLLFNVVMLCRIAQDEHGFDLDDVCQEIVAKMETRHPQVFGELPPNTQRKQDDSKDNRGILAGIPHSAPALVVAMAQGHKCAQVGFDWGDPVGVLDKIEEEIQELRQAMAAGRAIDRESELGDLLMATTSLARHLEVDPEAALAKANRRFAMRVAVMEDHAAREGRSLRTRDANDLEELWQRAKRDLAESATPPSVRWSNDPSV